MFQYCAIVVLLLAAIRSQCLSVPSDPCSANCNGTRLSIKIALNYPKVITCEKYNYTFDPCKGATCGFASKTSDNAVCQCDPLSSSKNTYSLGKISKAVWNITSNNPLTFTILYTGGDQAINVDRSSKITFTTGPTRTFTYVS